MILRRSQDVLSIAGIDFSYIREGSGKPILVLGSAVYYSKAFSSKLREHFELIFVDLRHFIGSYEPAEEELNKITFVLYPECSHSPQTEHPDEFDPILISWLTNL